MAVGPADMTSFLAWFGYVIYLVAWGMLIWHVYLLFTFGKRETEDMNPKTWKDAVKDWKTMWKGEGWEEKEKQQEQQYDELFDKLTKQQARLTELNRNKAKEEIKDLEQVRQILVEARNIAQQMEDVKRGSA